MVKKLLYIFAAALVAMTACTKPEPEDPGDKPDDPGKEEPTITDFKLLSDAVVNVGAESVISVLKFTAPEAWTASVSYPEGSDTDYVVLTPASGEAGEDIEVKVTIQSLPKDQDGRYFNVGVKSGSKGADVVFYQGNVFIPSTTRIEMGKDGGKAEFSVISNVDYNVTTYDSFDWAPATFDKATGKGSFNVASAGYDSRSAYVKFTIPAIQDPVLDDEGNDTGETADRVVKVYVTQEGKLQVAWDQQFFWSMFPNGTRESVALAGDYIIINCSLTDQGTGGALVFNKADGTYVTTVNAPSLTGVTNDDAGNIVISMGGNYPIDQSTWELIPDQQVPLYLFFIKKDDVAGILNGGDISKLQPAIVYSDAFYGYGLDNLRVTGDVFGDAVITMCSSGAYSVQIVDWDIKGGKYTDDGKGYTKYVDAPNFLPEDYSMGIWSSYDIVAKHLGNNSDSGLYYMGYDNNYNLQYLSSPSASWQEVLVSGATWEEGFTTFSTVEWNGHKYLGFIGVPYFAWADWDWDGTVDGYLPGHVWLVNIDNPEAPKVESKYEYYCDQSNWQYGDNADIKLTVEGDNLVAYIVDAASSQYMKIVYPKL